MNYRFLLVAISAMLVVAALASSLDNISAKSQSKSINKICINDTCTIQVQNSSSPSNTTYTENNLTDTMRAILGSLFGSH